MPRTVTTITEDTATALSVQQAARELGVGTSHIKRAIYSGALRAVDLRTPGSKRAFWRIKAADLAAYIASKEAQ